MQMTQRPSLADMWIDQLFSAKAVEGGGVIRRNRNWVAREIGRDRFFREVEARGFHLLETGEQLVVVCHTGKIHLHF